MATQTLTPLDSHRPASSADGLRRARLAVWADPAGPPLVWDFDDSPSPLLEALFLRTAEHCHVPALALRELIENLVHADFRGAIVSVLDGGSTLRVSDQGPGIDDVSSARQAGYSTASDADRTLIRGVGAGLPTVAALADDAGGRLELTPNLGGGLTATLSLPPGDEPGTVATVTDATRGLLALILELEAADAAQLAREAGQPLGHVARELVELEHRGLVARTTDGQRILTESGRDTVTGLF